MSYPNHSCWNFYEVKMVCLIMIVVVNLACSFIYWSFNTLTKMLWQCFVTLTHPFPDWILRACISEDGILWKNNCKLWKSSSADHDRFNIALGEREGGREVEEEEERETSTWEIMELSGSHGNNGDARGAMKDGGRNCWGNHCWLETRLQLWWSVWCCWR